MKCWYSGHYTDCPVPARPSGKGSVHIRQWGGGRQCTWKRNHCCRGKAIGIKYSEYVSVALGIQHALRMRHVAMCGLTAVQCFSILSHINGTTKKL